MFKCFQTDIMEFQVPDSAQEFHQDIIKYILLDSAKYNNNFSTNGLTARHGEPNLSNLDFEWSYMLRTFIMEVSDRYYESVTSEKLDFDKTNIECWYIQLGSSDMSLSHVHPGSDISGCYYLDVPQGLLSNQGSIVFVDPRPAARYSRLSNGRQIIINPKPGLGLVFPGWLEHYVIPHSSKDPRISISWNINLLD